MARLRNLFLDRDGTVIVDKHYLSDPDGVQLIQGAGEALAACTQAGMRLFIVTNQSGIGRGHFSPADYEACRDRLYALLAAFGATITGEAFCPHAPDAGCACRKPALGMWEALRAGHGLDPAECAMVGDKQADVSFGLDAGFACSVLVRTGHGDGHAARLGLPELDAPVRRLVAPREGWPDAQAQDIAAACAYILKNRKGA